MSPDVAYTKGRVTNYKVALSGELSVYWVSSNSGIVPVINLSADYVSEMIGNGTAQNVYRVE